jgi:hypothetical protein
MRGHAAWLVALLAVPLPLAAQEGWEDRSFAIGRYHWSLPTGDTRDYTDNDSWLGFAIEGRRFIAQDLSTSLLIGWTEFSHRTEETIADTVGGAQDRKLSIAPVMLGGQRYLGRPGGTQPYVGLYAGIYWIRQRLASGSGEFNEEDVLFGVAPEVGVALPLRPEVVMIFSARYDVPFSGGEFLEGKQSFQYWSLGLVLAYVL